MNKGEPVISNFLSMVYFNIETSITMLGDYKDSDHLKNSIKNEIKIFKLYEVSGKIKLDCLGMLEMYLLSPKRKLVWY